MKLLLILSVAFLLAAGGDQITSDCRCNDTQMFGRVKFVKYSGDVRIRFVEHQSPDLRIKFVQFTPRKCGEWQVVDNSEDFTVQVVTGGEDFTVQIDPDYPGIN